MSELAVVCDFDGTATVLDIGDEISKRFGGEAHWALQKQLFGRGELDTRGIIQGIYEHVVASEQEVLAFAVREAKLRDGFVELVAAAKERGAPFYLASGGLRQYIDAVLEAHVPAGLRAWIRVRANEAAFSEAGMKVSFPGDEASRAAGCVECGSCKRVSVAEARSQGAKYVIGLGDGFADRCLARFAEKMFAREGSFLHRWCGENGVACAPFTTFYEAAETVRGT
jgi:2-hydroxy-3-keto-5-methylthiopentenyl-1-phosphate phosphatase